MNKQNILGSALLGFMMAFLVVMPASASGEQVSIRSEQKACLKQAKKDMRAAIEQSNIDLKAAEKTAIMTWKQTVDSAKGLTGDARRTALEEATKTMHNSIKQAKKDFKESKKSAREGLKADTKACKPGKANNTTK